MAVSSVGLRLKCDCSGKAQKQLYSKLQTRFLVREDALIAKWRNCQTKKEEQDKIWSRVPKGGPIPRLTGRLTVGRKKNSNSNSSPRFTILAILTEPNNPAAIPRGRSRGEVAAIFHQRSPEPYTVETVFMSRKSKYLLVSSLHKARIHRCEVCTRLVV
jgi:hypothetical protein